MGHHGKDMTSPKGVMVDLKSTPLSNSQNRGRRHQAHLECQQHRLESFQSFGRHLSTQLHSDKFPVHLGDLPVASEHNDFSRLQNHA